MIHIWHYLARLKTILLITVVYSRSSLAIPVATWEWKSMNAMLWYFKCHFIGLMWCWYEYTRAINLNFGIFATTTSLTVRRCLQTGPSFFQTMTCRLFGSNPYLQQRWLVVEWTIGNKFRWHMNQNIMVFIVANAFKNVVRKTSASCSGLKEISMQTVV